jgi:Glutamate-cysteine ligase family 2(GCS2)
VDQLPAGRFSSELQRSVLEANSRPYVRLTDLAGDIAALRRAAIAAARPLGLGIVAAGTAPIADLDTLKITPVPRYEHMKGEYRVLVREQLICGTQVHVDVMDRDLAVAVAHRAAPWLPALLALSASSPFWLGTDTGYASYPSGDPAFTGQAHIVEPLAKMLIQPGRGQHGQYSLAVAGVDGLLTGYRIHSAVGQGGPHHGKVARAHPDRTLAGVDVGGEIGVAVHAAVAVEEVAMPRLRSLVAVSDS